jgi:hypothetical protein
MMLRNLAASNSTSFLSSLLVALLLFASMQVFRTQIAASQPFTIAGGFMGSLVFVSLLTVGKSLNHFLDESFFFVKAVSNFEMNTFGPNFQARVFPEGKKNFS